MVITNVNQVVYQGDGVNAAWPFTFPVTDDTEIRVQLNNADGTAVLIDSDYWVDIVNSTVYYPGYAPGAEPPGSEQPPKVQVGQTITIYREIPITQESDLGEKWPFYVIEFALDKLTMICQQIYSYTNRKLDDTLASMELLAGVVVDSGELQHITEQLNTIDEKAEIASASEASARISAVNASNSSNQATSVATALTDIYNEAIASGEVVAPAIDQTLSVSGAAADGQVTGLFRRAWQNKLDLSLFVVNYGTFNADGTINEGGTTTRLYTDLKSPALGCDIYIIGNPKYEYQIERYKDDGTTYIGGGNWLSGETHVTDVPYYFRLLIRLVGGASIDLADAASSFTLLMDKTEYQKDKLTSITPVYMGGINSEGQDVTTDIRLRTGYFSVPKGKQLRIKSRLNNFKFNGYRYDVNKNFVPGAVSADWTDEVVLPSINGYYRLLFVNNNERFLSTVFADYIQVEEIEMPVVAEVECYPLLSKQISGFHKLAHVPMAKPDTDIFTRNIYVSYYVSDVTRIESIDDGSLRVVLNRVNYATGEVYEKTILKPGDTVDGITLDSGKSVWDPTLFVTENTIELLCLVVVSNVIQYIHLSLDKETFNIISAELTNLTNVILGKITEVNGEYYAGAGPYGPVAVGTIVKSSDLTTWTTFASTTLDSQEGSSSPENDVTYYDNQFHLMTRVDYGSQRFSIYHTTFDDEGTLVRTKLVANTASSRPLQFEYNDELYAAVVPSNDYLLEGDNGTLVGRSVATILHYDKVTDEYMPIKNIPFIGVISYLFPLVYGSIIMGFFSSDFITKDGRPTSIQMMPMQIVKFERGC